MVVPTYSVVVQYWESMTRSPALSSPYSNAK